MIKRMHSFILNIGFKVFLPIRIERFFLENCTNRNFVMSVNCDSLASEIAQSLSPLKFQCGCITKMIFLS